MFAHKPQVRVAYLPGHPGWKIRASQTEQNAVDVISPEGARWTTYYGHRDGVYNRQGYITAFAWSPDGTQIVSASSTGSVHVWTTNGLQQEVLRRADERLAPAEHLVWDTEGIRF